MDASDRQLAVSWGPVEGATGYKVAARLTNGVEPFAWVEYEAESSPYVIEERWAGMSGLEYEVRAASVNAAGQSVWSDLVGIIAPELQAAPPGAVGIDTIHPYAPGDEMRVNLHSQRPFTGRSEYVWSVCSADGTACRLLGRGASAYLAPAAAEGKQVRAQTDYEKDGLSYTATAVVGTVNPRPPDGAIRTHLHLLESDSVQIKWDAARGGAIRVVRNDLLVVAPWGRIFLARSDGSVEQIEGRVPMNLEGLRSRSIPASKFRVADILLIQRSEDIWELFVAHHYFTGDDILFRLSSTTILAGDAGISASPSWRTVFDADTSSSDGLNLDRSGGRILTGIDRGSGDLDHLLVVVGDHGKGELAQTPASPFGKLLRVDADTGKAETLAFGLRNPQGLARDAAGNLWATEHGPVGGDELNLLEFGANYGWPSASYGVAGRGYGIGADAASDHAAYVPPAFAWVPAIGVSSVIVNDERAFPLWKDDLLVGSLSGARSDGRVNGHALFRVRREGTEVRYVERIELGRRIRDLANMPDGRIAILGDGGIVQFLSRSSKHCDEQSRERRLVYAAGCEDAGADESDPEG